MRCNDEFPILVLGEVGDVDFFVWSPRRASDEARGVACKLFHQWEWGSSILDGNHTIQSGVAHHRHILDAMLHQQVLRTLVLNKQVVELTDGFQGRVFAKQVPLEEVLVGTEDAAHAVGLDAFATTNEQVVQPELILDEDGNLWMCQTQEGKCVAWCVERQVTNQVSSLIVLPHLITGRREERQQNLVFRTFCTQAFHEWSSLLKLTQ